jgi:hypothetical protein
MQFGTQDRLCSNITVVTPKKVWLGGFGLPGRTRVMVLGTCRVASRSLEMPDKPRQLRLSRSVRCHTDEGRAGAAPGEPFNVMPRTISLFEENDCGTGMRDGD